MPPVRRPSTSSTIGSTRSVTGNIFTPYNAARLAASIAQYAGETENRKRRRSTGSMASISNNNSKKSKTYTQGTKGSSRAVKVTVKGKEGKKKVKKVKVSKELRLKVNKCIEEKKIRGTYQVVTYSEKALPNINAQSATSGFQDTLGLDASFTALEFLHQASVLFNGKADGARSKTSFADSIGVTDITGADVNRPTNNTSSLACTAKFTVLNSYEKIYVKNNSERTVTIDLYICEPKRAMFDGQTSVSTAGTALNPTPGESSNPHDSWLYALNQGNKTGQNVGNIGVTMLHTSPLGLAAFNTIFKSSKVNVKLEPGQDWNYFLQGPKMLDVDFSKYYKGVFNTLEGVLQPVQKWSRCLMWVVKQDLCSEGSKAGRWSGGLIANQPNQLLVERTIHGTITVPESTGMRVDGAALALRNDVPLQNNYRRPCYFANVYSQVSSGDFLRVDEQNANADKV